MPGLDALRANYQRLLTGFDGVGQNLGLSLEKFNPFIDSGNEHEQKQAAFDRMTTFNFSSIQPLKESYNRHLDEWRTIQQARRTVVSCTIKATSRVLLGTGNASVHNFGFNLSKPWGVPYISGSTLKGLVSSWLARRGGDAWWRAGRGAEKSPLQVELFGGIVKDDAKERAWAGSVIFNDALMLLGPQPCFVADIITSHHMKYYGGSRMPDGTEDPNPVGIVALRPDTQFFISLEGSRDATTFVLEVLKKALAEEGLGGKTAVGYGRFVVVESSIQFGGEKTAAAGAGTTQPVAPAKPASLINKGDQVEVVVLAEKTKKGAWRASCVKDESVVGVFAPKPALPHNVKAGDHLLIIVKIVAADGGSTFEFVKRADPPAPG